MLIRLLAGLIAVGVLIAPGRAREFGSRDQAVALVKRVQSKFANDGPAATFAAITDKAPGFVEKDLYVFVYDLSGTVVANGAHPTLIGKNRHDLVDANGKQVVSELIGVARRSGHGWIDYSWSNPVAVDDMSSYVERLGDKYVVGVPVFRSEDLRPVQAQNEN